MNPAKLVVLSLVAIGIAVSGARAQPVVNLRIVDMAALYEGYYKVAELNAKLNRDHDRNTREVEDSNKEGEALMREYQALVEKANNPGLSADAKAKAQVEAREKMEAIQALQAELKRFVQNAQASLKQRLESERAALLREIGEIASVVAKRKGVTVLVDKAGSSTFGVSNFVYLDPGFDITNEVMSEINKSKPTATTVTPSPTPAATPTPAAAAATSRPVAGGRAKP